MAQHLKQEADSNNNIRIDKKERHQECPECGLQPTCLLGLDHGEFKLLSFGQVALCLPAQVTL